MINYCDRWWPTIHDCQRSNMVTVGSQQSWLFVSGYYDSHRPIVMIINDQFQWWSAINRRDWPSWQLTTDRFYRYRSSMGCPLPSAVGNFFSSLLPSSSSLPLLLGFSFLFPSSFFTKIKIKINSSILRASTRTHACTHTYLHPKYRL